MTQSFEDSKKYIQEHGKTNDDGDVITVTKTDTLKYLQQRHHIEPAAVEAIVVGEKDIAGGATLVATELLVKNIESAKTNGDDPRELTAAVRFSTPAGALQVQVRAHRTVTSPRTREKSDQFGVVQVKAQRDSYVDKETAEKTRDLITAMIAGSETTTSD